MRLLACSVCWNHSTRLREHRHKLENDKSHQSMNSKIISMCEQMWGSWSAVRQLSCTTGKWESDDVPKHTASCIPREINTEDCVCCWMCTQKDVFLYLKSNLHITGTEGSHKMCCTQKDVFLHLKSDLHITGTERSRMSNRFTLDVLPWSWTGAFYIEVHSVSDSVVSVPVQDLSSVISAWDWSGVLKIIV